MAKVVVGAEVTVGTSQAEGSVKSLKQQLREAQADVANLSEKFGATSAAAVDAAKKAAQLKDAIGDAKALTDAFNPDRKFQAFSSALQGVVGGFTALQGAQALFGSESKELEKTLLKVQGAMALSQGINSILEAGDAFKNLQTVAVTAFRAIKGAISATGIGLLVVALGTIVAYWDDIKEAVSGVSEEQKNLATTTQANLKAEQEKLTAIDDQSNILKLQGKSEKDILNLKISQTDQVIKASEIQIQSSIQLTKSQVEAAQRNKDILQGILEFISAPIALTLRAIDKIGSIVGKDFGLSEGFYGSISKLVFDPVEVKKEGEKSVKEQQDALNKLRNQRAGFQLQIQSIDKQAADTKKKADEDAKKEQEKKDNEYLEAYRLLKEGEYQLEYDAYLKQKELDDKQVEEEKKAAEERIRIAEAERNAKVQFANDIGNALGILSDLVGKQTAAGKALGIAQSLINTYTGATEVLRAKSVLPEPAATISKVVNVAAIIATGLKAVKQIIGTKVPGGGGGASLGSASSVTAPIAPQVSTTALNQGQINQLSSATNRAFVLESDVTGNQERIERLNRAARIN